MYFGDGLELLTLLLQAKYGNANLARRHPPIVASWEPLPIVRKENHQRKKIFLCRASGWKVFPERWVGALEFEDKISRKMYVVKAISVVFSELSQQTSD